MRCLLLAAAFASLAGPAAAQVHYNGYDIGPDYGAMLEEEMRKFNRFGDQLAAYERQVTERAMADPLCQKLYQGHQQQGGQIPFPDFAYLCWATRYFTPDGIAYFQQIEQENWKKERLAAIDLRKMEAIRGAAQNDLNNTIANNDSKIGLTVAGSDTYFDPWSSQTVVLPQFTQPNQPFWDAQTQRYYAMDTGGTVLVWNNGTWQPIQIQPRR
jgi:hypothetical protein